MFADTSVIQTLLRDPFFDLFNYCAYAMQSAAVVCQRNEIFSCLHHTYYRDSNNIYYNSFYCRHSTGGTIASTVVDVVRVSVYLLISYRFFRYLVTICLLRIVAISTGTITIIFAGTRSQSGPTRDRV